MSGGSGWRCGGGGGGVWIDKKKKQQKKIKEKKRGEKLFRGAAICLILLRATRVEGIHNCAAFARARYLFFFLLFYFFFVFAVCVPSISLADRALSFTHSCTSGARETTTTTTTCRSFVLSFSHFLNILTSGIFFFFFLFVYFAGGTLLLANRIGRKVYRGAIFKDEHLIHFTRPLLFVEIFQLFILFSILFFVGLQRDRRTCLFHLVTKWTWAIRWNIETSQRQSSPAGEDVGSDFGIT